MSPRPTIRKELYLPAVAGVTTWVKQRYLGPGLRLEEGDERGGQTGKGPFHSSGRQPK